MHPIIPAYVRWSRLYKLVVFGGRADLEGEKEKTWQFYQELVNASTS